MTTQTIHVDTLQETDSSFIDEVGFLFDSPSVYTTSGKVFVKIGDNVYRYDGIEYEEYANLATAWSVGSEYHTFVSDHGGSNEQYYGAAIERLPEEFRVSYVDESGNEHPVNVDEGQSELPFEGDNPNYPGELPLDPQEDLLVNGYFYTEEEIRGDAVKAACMLFSGRKNVISSDVIAFASKFEEYIKNG